MWIAEVDIDAGVDADAAMGGQLVALIPGQRFPQIARKGLDGGDHGLGDHVGLAAGGQVQQLYEPGGALDQGADLGGLILADNQIALPMAGYGAVNSLGGTQRDVDHARNAATAITCSSSATGFAQRASSAQALGQFAAQLPASLYVKRLVDGLVGHLHLRAVGIGLG